MVVLTEENGEREGDVLQYLKGLFNWLHSLSGGEPVGIGIEFYGAPRRAARHKEW